MNDPIVSIRSVSVRFGAITALKDISIDIRPGEIFALLGPSGCGKSTLLRAISGFETPSSGELLLDGEDMTRLPPNKRPINMVFQSYAVFPHMSVSDNVAYGLKMEGIPGDEIRSRVEEALAQVHLAEFGQRKPDQLSGGQRQRVALARALVKRPRVLLLDEPLSALDAKLRDAMRLELVKLQDSVGITFVIVTHDQAEAMAIADRIAVLESGHLRQIASPVELYKRPADAFVADFIGTMHSVPLKRVVPRDNGQLALETDDLGTLTVPSRQVPDQLDPTHEHYQADEGDTVGIVGIRPEHVRVSLDTSPGDADHRGTDARQGDVVVDGTLGDVAFQGQYSIVEIVRPDGTLSAIVDDSSATRLFEAGTGTPLLARWALDDMLVLPHRAHLGG